MNSRERVIKTLNHEEPDRIPFDLSGTTVTGICKGAFVNAMKYKGLSAEFVKKEVDPISQIVTPVEETLVILKSDTRRIGARRIAEYENTRYISGNIWEVTDVWGCLWRMDQTKDLYYNQVSFPLAGYELLSEGLSNYRFPDWKDQAYMENDLTEQAVYLEDYCGIADRNCAGLTETSLRIRGYEKWYLDTLIDPDSLDYMYDKIIDFKIQYWDSLISWVEKNNLGHKIQVVSECDDLGTQTSTLVDPDYLRTRVIPRFARLWAYIKKKIPDAKIFMHTCGSVREILPDLIEAGLDIYNPVQFTAANMDLKSLKNEFGKDLVFWGGGIDTQTTLSKGTPQQVRDEVKRIIDIMAPGGGFVFAAVHNIQNDVTPDNFWAMWETLMEYGKY